ncbi:MAG: sulfatase-like hydrolase/transferase, partial [Opitutaceae bacterium]
MIILADDLGYGDLGCYGHRRHRTPHLDRLAADGLRFTDFHSNGPMCSPTRAALMTGLYPSRFGRNMETALSNRDDRNAGLPLAAVTIAEALRERGYATGAFGKWHLGYEPPFVPTRQGFDEFRGLLSGDGDHHTHRDRGGRPDWWHNEDPVTESGYTAELL